VYLEIKITGRLDKMKHVILLTIGGAALVLSGCATITRGTTEALVIESTPSGADVDLSNGMRCKTPCTLEMKRKSAVVLDIKKEGYEDVRVNVLSEISGSGAAGMAGNVLLGGVIGAGVDAASGATKTLRPNPVRVVLNPKPAEPSDAVPTKRTQDQTNEAVRACIADGKTPGTADFTACLEKNK
jgi:hypothetical protein